MTREKALTRSQVLRIFHAKGTHLQIGMAEDVSACHVGAIKTGRYHSDITGKTYVGVQRQRISTAQRLAVLQSTGSQQERARRCGISRSAAQKILSDFQQSTERV